MENGNTFNSLYWIFFHAAITPSIANVDVDAKRVCCGLCARLRESMQQHPQAAISLAKRDETPAKRACVDTTEGLKVDQRLDPFGNGWLGLSTESRFRVLGSARTHLESRRLTA